MLSKLYSFNRSPEKVFNVDASDKANMLFWLDALQKKRRSFSSRQSHLAQDIFVGKKVIHMYFTCIELIFVDRVLVTFCKSLMDHSGYVRLTILVFILN